MSEEDQKLGNIEFDKIIRQRIVNEVASKYDHIRNKINELKLWGYNFYLYIFPFIDKTKAVKQIMTRLENPGGNV